jgi:adenylate cyclase
MATFGAAAPSETFAHDALEALIEIDAGMADWNRRRRAGGLDPLDYGMGLASGEIVFGAVGDTSRLEYTVIGDAVNLAAKLEKHCKTLGVRATVSAETLTLAEEQDAATGRFARHDPRTIDGVAEPQAVATLDD